MKRKSEKSRNIRKTPVKAKVKKSNLEQGNDYSLINQSEYNNTKAYNPFQTPPTRESIYPEQQDFHKYQAKNLSVKFEEAINKSDVSDNNQQSFTNKADETPGIKVDPSVKLPSLKNRDYIFRKINIKIVLTSLIILIFLGISSLSAYAYSAKQEYTKECKTIIQEINQEYDLTKDFCDSEISDFKVSLDTQELLHPPLKKVKEKQAEYRLLISEYENLQVGFDNIKEVALILGVYSNEDSQNFVNKLNKTNKYSIKKEILVQEKQNIQHELAKYINNLQWETQNLEKTIIQAEKDGIKVEPEKSLIANSNFDYQTPEKAKEVHSYSQSLKNAQTKLNNKIYSKNTYGKYDNLEENQVLLPVLMYHRIDYYEDFPESLKSTMLKEMTISPENFRKQLNFLIDRGYQTVTLSEIEEAFFNKDRSFFDGKKIILTFDDGFTEHYSIAYQELKSRNMTGVFGIYTNGIEQIGRTKIKEMHDNGMEIVSHSVSHCMMGPNLDFTLKSPRGGAYKPCSNTGYGFNQGLMPTEEIRYELRESKKTLEDIIQDDVDYFIYPFGSYNDQILEIAKEENYRMGLKVGEGPVVSFDKPLTINRVNVSGRQEALGGWFAQHQ